LAGPVIAADSSINETGYVKIGGIDQWVTIQGANSHNSASLFLHGGPGEAQSPFLSQFNPWEQDFIIANRDQRGTGKTFGRNGLSTPDKTLGRLIDDAIEVGEHLRSRLSEQKVILIGPSWGSFWGVHVIKRRPDLFHAFVGTGQLVSFVVTVASQVQWARQGPQK
jgi:pimeloyl-ACP methyl ester carboxylesterase